MTSHLEKYLERLDAALKARGVAAERIVAEAREHLIDGIAEGRRIGLSPADAVRRAIERFGSPEMVAATFADRSRVQDALLFTLGVITRTLRRWLTANGPREPIEGMSGLHDRQRRAGALHFLTRAKRSYVLPDVSEVEARNGLIPLFERAARELGRFGIVGSLQTLDLLNDTSDAGRHVRRYRATFANGASLFVVHTSDRRSTAVDITPE